MGGKQSTPVRTPTPSKEAPKKEDATVKTTVVTPPRKT